jgi:hypothetical protein
MARTRLAAELVQPAKAGAKGPLEWERLLRKVHARAKLLQNDRLLRALEAARQEGRIAQCLKKLSILSEADLERELPDPNK